MKKLDVKAYKLHKLADYIGVIFLVMLLLLSGNFTGGRLPCLFLSLILSKR